MLEAYEQIKTLVLGLEEEVRKASGGNKAAGTRLRKSLQELKNMAQTLRLKVLETREGGEGSEPPAPTAST